MQETAASGLDRQACCCRSFLSDIGVSETGERRCPQSMSDREPRTGPFLHGLFSRGISRGKRPIKAVEETAH